MWVSSDDDPYRGILAVEREEIPKKKYISLSYFVVSSKFEQPLFSDIAHLNNSFAPIKYYFMGAKLVKHHD